MTLTIDTTIGGASANSYRTVAEATTYLEGRLNSSAWTSASATDQAAALVEAARTLGPLNWQGRRVTETQALSWPRQWALNPDSPYGGYYTSTEIPTRVGDAQCELALEFLRAGTTDIAAADPNAGVIEKTIDVLTTRWSANQRPTGLARYPRVLDNIKPLFEPSGTTTLRG